MTTLVTADPATGERPAGYAVPADAALDRAAGAQRMVAGAGAPDGLSAAVVVAEAEVPASAWPSTPRGGT